MRRHFLSLIFLFSWLLPLSSMQPVAARTVDWTFMFYDDADFADGYDPFHDFRSDAFSDTNVHVLVLQDTKNGPAKLCYVNPDHSIVLLDDQGEVDMGDPDTLRDFVLYGKNFFPAERYLLSIYDHGGGWRGACLDETDGGWMTMDAMHGALHESDSVDILCFSAPCLMGAIESMHELRDVADIYIGSKELSGYCYWNGVLGEVCGLLNAGGALSDVTIGSEIIRLIEESAYPYKEKLTMSTVRLDKTGALIDSLSGLSQTLRAGMSKYAFHLWSARNEVKEFGESYADDIGVIDLYDLVEALGSIEGDPAVLSLLPAIMQRLENAVIAETHGVQQENAHGMSVYFPRASRSYNMEYETYSLDFVKAVKWNSLLEAYYSFDALSVDADRLSASSGGRITFTLDAGLSHPSRH